MTQVATDPGATEPLGPARQLARGAFWSTATWGLTTLVNLAAAVALVRLMSRGQYGSFATASAAISVLAIVTGFGLGPAVAQLGAAERTREGDDGLRAVAATALRGARRVAVVSLAAGGAVALVLLRETTLRAHPVVGTVLLMAPVAALTPLITTCASLLRLTYRPAVLTAVSVLPVALQGAFIAVVAGSGHRSAAAMGLAKSIAVVVGAGVTVAVMRPWTRGLVQHPGVSWRTLLPFGGAMLLTGVFATAVSQLDVLILGATRGSQAVGLYQPASRLIDVLVGLPILVGAFFLPIVAGVAARQDHKAVGQLYHWASRWSLAVCAPALGVVIVQPTTVLRLVFGSGFAGLGTPTRVLAAGAVVHIGFGLNGLTLDSYGLAWLVTRRLIASLAVSVASCAVLIPLFGILGAAEATAIGLTTANLLCSMQLWRRFGVGPWDRAGVITVLSFGASLALAAGASGLVGPAVLRCAVTVVVVGVVTFTSALVAGGPSDQRAVAAEWRRVRGLITGEAGP